MISNLNEIQADLNPIKVEYQSYDNLAPFSEDEDYENLHRTLIFNLNDETNWLNQYEALNTLRRINKFSSIIFNSILPNVCVYITKLTSSIRSNLSKLSIMLVKEIFTNQNYSYTNFKLLKNLIYSVTLQSSSNKSFIKDESLASLDALSNNFIFHNTCTLNCLIEDVASKSLVQSENSFNASIKLITNWSKEDIFSGTNYLQWEGIFSQILKLHSLKREPYIKRACRLIENLVIKFGDEDFNNLLNSSSFDGHTKNLIFTMLKQVETKKKKPSDSIRDHLNKQKFK